MKNVFCDLHHLGLYNSLHLLFEKRLGYKMFRPIGTEWLDKGYWRIAEIYRNHPATVAQYLNIPLYAVEEESGIYKIWEQGHDFWEYGITYDAFMRIKPEIVVATVPEHIESFKRLAREIGAKMIYQLGNNWPASAGLADNIMASASIKGFPDTSHVIQYHQEFPLDIFKKAEGKTENVVSSFINCLNTASIYERDWKVFEDVERSMLDWKFRSYGGSCRDGVANGQKEVAKMMSDSKFIWHTKWGGDGFGHILYNSAAVGKPTISKVEYYRGKMGEELLEDGVTCVAIDGLNTEQIVEKIKHYSEENIYQKMCEIIYHRFKEKVDFDKEEVELRKFIENLL